MSDDDTEPVDESGGRGPWPIVLIIVLLAFTTFVVQNGQSVEVEWLAFNFSMPLWALLLGSAVLGVIIRDLVGWIRRRRD
jgi:uncharacterized integral membrane protein